MFTLNCILAALFGVSITMSDVTSDSTLRGIIFPIMTTLLFLYFLLYVVLKYFEHRIFPHEKRVIDYLDGVGPSLADGDNESEDDQETGRRE